MKRRVSNHIESWASLIPFRIANYEWDDYPTVVCEIEQDGVIGWGEALGVYYLDETEKTMLKQLEAVAADLAGGASRKDLLELLPAGGARNAADAALWDLEAQLNGTSVWQMAGVEAEPVQTVFTIGLEPEPEQMAAGAAAASDVSLLKIKLNNDRPVERIAAVELQQFAPELHALGVEFIEQPLPRGGDDELEGYESPVPLCADESCLTLDDLENASRRYQISSTKPVG